MVILKNIEKTKSDISADYYPEGKEPKGFMKMNLSNEEIVEHDMANMIAAQHVCYELKRLAKSDNTPTEKTVLWY